MLLCISSCSDGPSLLRAMLRNITAEHWRQTKQALQVLRSNGFHGSVLIEQDELYVTEWRGSAVLRGRAQSFWLYGVLVCCLIACATVLLSILTGSRPASTSAATQTDERAPRQTEVKLSPDEAQA
ncbi:hypothetical protein BOX15_Mlig012714g1 [Macrostomum lignano]|uniref:Uncharacterized protein n=2 Tax=Macrostomum lignano TaxID=282301 RepID=A0A267FFJ8_9PLAT|nr:hypothetical protein BOX15_Mlig012714g1 [Macrostomum lignano]